MSSSRKASSKSGKGLDKVPRKEPKGVKETKVDFEIGDEDLDKVSGGAYGAAGSGWGCTNACGR